MKTIVRANFWKMYSRVLGIFLLTMLSFSTLSCEPDDRTEIPEQRLLEQSVSFNEPAADIEVGDEFVLSAQFEPDYFDPQRTYEWENSNPEVASITVNDGYSATITALQPGSTSITISSTDGHLETVAEITVSEKTFILTAMAFNMRAANADLQQVADLIETYGADVVVLRQVDKNTGRSGNVDQAGVIADYADMNDLFIKGFNYDGGEYGIAILSRYPINESQAITMVTAVGGEDRPFGYFTVELEEDFEVVFGGVQLDDGWNMALRGPNNRKFANEILDHLGNEDRPVILGGNFSWATGTEEHIEIFHNNGFTPACTECAFTSPVSNPNAIADHFMYKETGNVQITVADYEIAEENIHDQTPLIATFEFRRTE